MAKTTSDGELEATEVATAGVVVDDYGNRWAIPVDPELGEDVSFEYSPVTLPKTDPRFHYQFERTDRLAHAISDRFVPVRRSEVGLAGITDANLKLRDYGINPESTDDPVHQVGDLTLVKIPIELRDARLKRAEREANHVKRGIEPPKKVEDVKGRLKERLKNDGIRFEESAETVSNVVADK